MTASHPETGSTKSLSTSRLQESEVLAAGVSISSSTKLGAQRSDKVSRYSTSDPRSDPKRYKKDKTLYKAIKNLGRKDPEAGEGILTSQFTEAMRSRVVRSAKGRTGERKGDRKRAVIIRDGYVLGVEDVAPDSELTEQVPPADQDSSSHGAFRCHFCGCCACGEYVAEAETDDIDRCYECGGETFGDLADHYCGACGVCLADMPMPCDEEDASFCSHCVFSAHECVVE
jgi:hypothetical protein